MNGEVRRGTAYGFLAYLLWGAFPLYFRALDESGAVEILVHRVVWSLLICLVALAVLHSYPQLRQVLRSARNTALLTVAAVLIAVNWGVYIYAVNSGHVVEAALGYFINPLITVALGVLVLGEKLRILQWSAVAVGALAVIVLTLGYGRPPWIALILACSFAGYGLAKKQVGGQVGALTGLAAETVILGPVALGALVFLEATGRGTFGANPPWQALLLISAGAVTVVPLLLFAAAARRVPLTTIGLLQFLTPVLQLLCGVVLLGEEVPLVRWVGFSLVWVALALLTVDSLTAARRQHRLVTRTPEAVPLESTGS